MIPRATVDAAHSLGTARRLIVKVGSALLIDSATGRIRRAWLEALVDDLAALRKSGIEILVVTSGAVACGREPLGLGLRKLALEEKQAAAAVGQIRLCSVWGEAFARHDLAIAQVLLSYGDTEERKRHLNARATLNTLLGLGAVPVINENDTVATAEIRFGDNDRLAARVAQMISADTLLLLSDIDGLYTADPRHDPNAQHLPVIEQLTPEIEAMAGKAPPGYSSGGMITKLLAARIAMGAGCRMAIARGLGYNPLAALAEGRARASWFLPSANPPLARKKWIAGAIAATGTVTIDDGAVRALSAGASLLPAGITAVTGSFRRGDVIAVTDATGRPVARGITAYDAEDAAAIKGRKSAEIEAILGYAGREALIHRDDLVVG